MPFSVAQVLIAKGPTLYAAAKAIRIEWAEAQRAAPVSPANEDVHDQADAGRGAFTEQTGSGEGA